MSGDAGFCGETAELRLAFAGLHSGEEPPLCGNNGSGTVFVSGCNLGCEICQNRQISQPSEKTFDGVWGDCHRPLARSLGRIVKSPEFGAICMTLQDRGAENINIVTGSHAVPAIVQGLEAAKSAGLHIPVVWNSSGYEKPETLEFLAGIVDTWLPDMKTLDGGLAQKLFNAPDYPAAAKRAIQWMILNKPGSVIIRHLVLPGLLESTRTVLQWFAEHAAGKALLSLMTQYTPVTKDASAPGRYVSGKEYDTVMGWLAEYGIEDGFCQELVTGSSWLPDFTRPNPFSSQLSVPVWHYQNS